MLQKLTRSQSYGRVMFLANFWQFFLPFFWAKTSQKKKPKIGPKKQEPGVTFRHYVRFGSFYAPNNRISMGIQTVYVGHLKS